MNHFASSVVKAIGSVDPVALKVIGTFQIRLRIRQRLEDSLQMNVLRESRRSNFSPASGLLASGTVILNSVLGVLIFSPAGESSGARMPVFLGRFDQVSHRRLFVELVSLGQGNRDCQRERVSGGGLDCRHVDCLGIRKTRWADGQMRRGQIRESQSP